MNSVAKKMDFDVEVNLKEKGTLYNIKIDLENDVDSHAREFAINLAGAIVRNNFQSVYGPVYIIQCIYSALCRF